MELLQKLKEDGMIDAILYHTATTSQDALDYDINDMEPANFNFDAENTLSSL